MFQINSGELSKREEIFAGRKKTKLENLVKLYKKFEDEECNSEINFKNHCESKS